VLAGRQASEVNIENQKALSGVVVLNGSTFTQIDGIDCLTQLCNMTSRKLIEGIGNRGLLSKALKSPTLSKNSIGTNTSVDMRDGLAAAHNTDQASDEFILGCISNLLLVEIYLLIQGVKELSLSQTITEQG
jgi:hypothetical protein